MIDWLPLAHQGVREETIRLVGTQWGAGKPPTLGNRLITTEGLRNELRMWGPSVHVMPGYSHLQEGYVVMGMVEDVPFVTFLRTDDTCIYTVALKKHIYAAATKRAWFRGTVLNCFFDDEEDTVLLRAPLLVGGIMMRRATMTMAQTYMQDLCDTQLLERVTCQLIPSVACNPKQPGWLPPKWLQSDMEDEEAPELWFVLSNEGVGEDSSWYCWKEVFDLCLPIVLCSDHSIRFAAFERGLPASPTETPAWLSGSMTRAVPAHVAERVRNPGVVHQLVKVQMCVDNINTLHIVSFETGLDYRPDPVSFLRQIQVYSAQRLRRDTLCRWVGGHELESA